MPGPSLCAVKKHMRRIFDGLAHVDCEFDPRSAHSQPRARSRQQMRMQVIDLLSTARPRIDDRAETCLATFVRNAQLIGETRNQYQHLTKQGRIALGTVRERRDVLARYH